MGSLSLRQEPEIFKVMECFGVLLKMMRIVMKKRNEKGEKHEKDAQSKNNK